MAYVQVDAIGKHVEKANIGFMYKNQLSISFLGLVDNVGRVSVDGYKAVQMNKIIHIKSSKNHFENCIREYQDNYITGDEEIIKKNPRYSSYQFY